MAQKAAQPTAQQHAAMAQANNNAIRGRVKQVGIEMTQLQQSFSLTAPNQSVPNLFNFVPKNVGLLRRFYVEVIVSFATAAGTTACARTPFGPSNIFSNVQFIDFQNQARINTAGWHLSVVNSVKSKASAPIGSAEVSDSPLGFGNNFAPITAPATVAASTNATVAMVYEIPICYSDNDLRGAIYMATTGATAQLQMTLNQQFFGATGSDPTNYVYLYSGTVPTISSVVVNVYQDYLDQLPMQGNSVLLPAQDLNTVYQLLYTNVSGLTVNQPFGIPYTNLRSFLSTTLVYDNAGLNAGTDLQNVGLQSANNTFIWQKSPRLMAYQTRKMINADMPVGTYYFDHRHSPISTAQFGNMQLVLLPSVVNAGAQALVGYEFMAARQSVAKSASLPVG